MKQQKDLYNTYFAQYCVWKQFLTDKEDPFLEFLKLVKTVYQPNFEPTEEDIEAYRKKEESSETSLRRASQNSQSSPFQHSQLKCVIIQPRWFSAVKQVRPFLMSFFLVFFSLYSVHYLMGAAALTPRYTTQSPLVSFLVLI